MANIHARLASLTCSGHFLGPPPTIQLPQRLSLQTSLTREPNAQPG